MLSVIIFVLNRFAKADNNFSFTWLSKFGKFCENRNRASMCYSLNFNFFYQTFGCPKTNLRGGRLTHPMLAAPFLIQPEGPKARSSTAVGLEPDTFEFWAQRAYPLFHSFLFTFFLSQKCICNPLIEFYRTKWNFLWKTLLRGHITHTKRT